MIYVKGAIMSSTICMIPLIATLLTAGFLINSDDPWHFYNNDQQEVLSEYLSDSYTQKLKYFKQNKKHGPDELTCNIFQNVESIKDFLQNDEYQIYFKRQLQEIICYFTSTMRINVPWNFPLFDTFITHRNKNYQAISISTEQNNIIACLKIDMHPYIIIKLKISNNDTIYMTVAHKNIASFALLSYVEKLSNYIHKQEEVTIIDNCNIICFPLININDIVTPYLFNNIQKDGLGTKETHQQTTLNLDKNGIAITSAASMCLSKNNDNSNFDSTSKFRNESPCYNRKISTFENYILNEPFYLWFERKYKNEKIIYCAAYVDKSSWQEYNS